MELFFFYHYFLVLYTLYIESGSRKYEINICNAATYPNFNIGIPLYMSWYVWKRQSPIAAKTSAEGGSRTIKGFEEEKSIFKNKKWAETIVIVDVF